MQQRALVIDDDPFIREEVAEILESIGHSYDMATCQQEARQLLASNEYAYYLLDLEIPIRPGARPRIQNGQNLLVEIVQRSGLLGPPVIVITGHGTDGPRLARQVLTEGAVDFVNKPFPTTGETLDRAIRDALQRQAQRRAEAQRSCAPESAPASGSGAFHGGTMLFGAEHISLCGVKIISNKGTGQSMMILDELRKTDGRGRYVRLSAEELAEAIDAPGGVATVTSCIAHLRRNIAERLERELGIRCGLEDVIARDGQGYHLRQWIRVCDEPGTAAEETCASANRSWNHRQRWVLVQLERGTCLSRRMLEERFGVAAKTAKRDLAELRQSGRIQFVRKPAPGHYRLRDR